MHINLLCSDFKIKTGARPLKCHKEAGKQTNRKSNKLETQHKSKNKVCDVKTSTIL